MTSTKKRTAAALTATILTVALAAPTLAAEAPDEPVRVSSYKGSTLEVGKRSGLIIDPSSTGYTVTSSNPDTVAVEQMPVTPMASVTTSPYLLAQQMLLSAPSTTRSTPPVTSRP